MQIKTGQYEIEIIDEYAYTPGSVDNVRRYSKEYMLANHREYMSEYGIICNVSNSSSNSCILLAGGARTTIHEHSAIVLEYFLYIAVGNQLCCLRLPSLDLLWCLEVDLATCFGIYYSSDNRCLISHGECDIARISHDGEIEWSVSGKDIFTEGFSLFPDHIEAIDFNYEKYWIDIVGGEIKLMNN